MNSVRSDCLSPEFESEDLGDMTETRFFDMMTLRFLVRHDSMLTAGSVNTVIHQPVPKEDFSEMMKQTMREEARRLHREAENRT